VCLRACVRVRAQMLLQGWGWVVFVDETDCVRVCVRARQGDMDWDAIFPRCRWFHTGGLYTALGDFEFILDAMQKARLRFFVFIVLFRRNAAVW
jgi:hypothetical protein